MSVALQTRQPAYHHHALQFILFSQETERLSFSYLDV